MQPSIEGIQAQLGLFAEGSLPAAKNAKPEQFIHTCLLSRLSKG